MAKTFSGKGAAKAPSKAPVTRQAPKRSKAQPDAVRGNSK